MEVMHSSLLSYLACPLCKGKLKNAGTNQVECLSCEAVYPVDDGIPVLLPPQLEEFKILEAEFHSNEADYFAERVNKFSYRVSRYHEDYLTCFRDYEKGAVVLEVSGGGGLEACRLKDMGGLQSLRAILLSVWLREHASAQPMMVRMPIQYL